MIWDQALWAILAISVWTLYQTQPYRTLRGRLEDQAKKMGLKNARILGHWVFWTLIPVGILPIVQVDTVVVWVLLFLVEYLSGLVEFYARNTIMKDRESAKRVISWTEDISWSHAIIGGLGQNIPEETFFRGYLLAETYPLSPWLGYGFSSLAFGMVHRYWDRWKVLNTIIAGLILAYLFIYTDSIIPPITAHLANNLLIIPPARHWSKKLLDSLGHSQTKSTCE